MVGNVVAEYVAQALTVPLPEAVVSKATDHILDTAAAIVSGGVMTPGEAGAHLARAVPGVVEATVLATGQRTDATRAALANAMAAHADETDDSHEPSLTHPGCAIVPAAFAVAEREGRSGRDLVRAVVLGYDVGTRVTRALWSVNDTLRTQGHSTHAIGGLFGAAAASAALSGLSAQQVGYVFSYACQEASGSRTWRRDVEHVEKAYTFAGMPASTGVWVALLVSLGWTGVDNVFEGQPNLFDIFGIEPDPDAMLAGLGSHFEIQRTNIKRFSVGSPIQAPLDGLLQIFRRESLTSADVESAEVRMPASLVRVVDDPEMPNINLQYLTNVALQDGDVGFAAAHDRDRFLDWRAGGRQGPLVEIVKDPDMAPVRQAITTVRLRDGREFREHVTAVRGTADNPMTTEEVDAKARDLVEPVLGTQRSALLIDWCRRLDDLPDVRALSELFPEA